VPDGSTSLSPLRSVVRAMIRSCFAWVPCGLIGAEDKFCVEGSELARLIKEIMIAVGSDWMDSYSYEVRNYPRYDS
jgi:hypothetical protein